MQSTIREHRDGGHAGGVFNRYALVKVSRAPQSASKPRPTPALTTSETSLSAAAPDPEGVQQEAVGEIQPPQEGGVGGEPQPLQRAHAVPRSVPPAQRKRSAD